MNESQINPPAASSHGHMVNGKLHLVDNQGRMVPENKIRPALLLEDQTVMFIIAKAKELNARILKFRVMTRVFHSDKHNRINKEALLSLRKLEIDDERWKLAMAA